MQTQTCAVRTQTPLTLQRVMLGVMAVVIAYFSLQVSGILTFSPQVTTATNLGAVLLVGLVASLSSCTAMVTGVVAAVSATQVKVSSHVYFHVGRLLGFAGLGVVVGWLGQMVSLSVTANSLLVIVIALLMLTLGVHLMRLLPPGVWFFAPPAKLTQAITALTTSHNPLIPGVIGVLTFFLPCGFTQSMQLYALSTGSPVQAALIMTVFAIGTLPSLAGISLLASKVTGTSKVRMNYAVGAVVVALGIANLHNGLTLLGWTGFRADYAPVVMAAVILPDGSQRIEMEITPAGYAPKNLTVVEDIPVTWEIYGTEQLGCADTLVSQTFDLAENIQPGFNQIMFTPTEPGVYAFSCSMGMVRGTMTVLPGENTL
ncbi:MAG: sulfite exporter TauE/SafE family protein [Patescibacteria group bacterium]